MKRKKIFTLLILALSAVSGFAQSDDFGVWASAGVEKKLSKKLSAEFEGEFRSRDNSKKVERWTGSLGLEYELTKHIKIGTGYEFIYANKAERTTSKGNTVSSYWSPRHRFNFSIQGDFDASHFNFSLRERYQYTYRVSTTAKKYDEDGDAKADEEITGKGYNVLRTRPMIKYNIPHSMFKPYLSVEFYNSLTNGSIDKTRYRIGTQLKLNKQNAFDIFYLYQKEADDDDVSRHVIGIGYTYKF